MEPSSDLLASFETLAQVAAWVPVKDPVLRPILEELGLEADDPPRLMATLSKEIVDEAANAAKITRDGVSVGLKPAQKSQVGVLWATCQLRCGLRKTQEKQKEEEEEEKKTKAATLLLQQTGNPVSREADRTSLTTVALNETVNQVSDKTVTLMSEEDIQACYKVYNDKMEKPPPQDEEPGDEQLSAINGLVLVKKPPYGDFAILKPYHLRHERTTYFKGLIQVGPGKWRRVELRGPKDFEEWMVSYRVLRCILIMLRLVSIAALDEYSALIGHLYKRYGPKCWALLYQTEDRMRRERMIRLKRKGAALHQEAKDRGHTTSFDESRPWDWVWREAVGDAEQTKYWTPMFREAANLICSGAISEQEVLDDDAPIDRPGRAAASPPPRRGRERSRKRDRSRNNRDDYPSKRQRSGAQRVHKVGPDGLLVMNRQGIELCKGFQCGKCNEPAIRGRCPQNNNKAHNCAKCLDQDHGADECERAVKEPSSSSSGRGRGGKGKGKGRGRARY